MADMKPIVEQSFGLYAAAVLQSRALVDVRDCLKPSARQIFYCLQTDKFVHDRPFQKTLKGIGSAMRLYIHGDSSAEGIIMRAGQPFAMRYPLMEVEGSYGNLMESGNWAAPRYTASRLSSLSSYLFSDIKKNTIQEWRDNYDDTEQYPAVLPSKGFYNLVNGSSGIGTGMASSIPQYNIKELNKALIYLLYHPDCDFKDIYCAPDFATGGILLNEEEVKESMKNGTGKACRLRSKIEFDYNDNCFVVKEIPYSVYTNTICKQLENILESEDNPGVERFNDLTGETPNIKIYLKRGANENKVLQYLYKNTHLQYWYGVNFTMLGNSGRYPKVFTWKEMLQAHIDHEKEVYRRGFEFDLTKIKDRIHIIDGILIVIANLEEVIEIIKNASTTVDASNKLQQKFLLDSEQAKAVLNIKLSQLARLEVKKYEDERNTLDKEKIRIENILNTESLFFKEIENGFNEVAKRFGDERRTLITNIAYTEGEEVVEQRVPEEDCVVIMTKSGLIKRIPSSSFKVQKRNGTGIKTQDGITTAIIRTNTIDSLMVFTNKGRMYRIKVEEIPIGTNTNKGCSIGSLVQMENGEFATLIYSIYYDTDAKYILFTTKNGIVKKTELAEYVKTKKRGGISAILLRDNDELAAVSLIKDEEIMLITKMGMAIKFKSLGVSPTGRATTGMKGINLVDGDNVIEALPIRDSEDQLAIFSTKGLGKRVKLNEFTTQTRGGRGVIAYKPSAQSGFVASAVLVDEDDNVFAASESKGICIAAKDIPILGRSGIGVSIIKDRNITSVSKV